MSSFDWLTFLRRHNITYVTSGKNVARDHIAIPCPFCGSADPSQHMGISLRGEGWGCLRDPQHRGSDRTRGRLIQVLLRCSWAEATRIAGTDEADILTNTFASQFENIFGTAPVAKKQTLLELPPEFKSFAPLQRSASPYVHHLIAKRGITMEQIYTLTDDYDVGYCPYGEYGGRIIFPLYYNRRLVTWTGRAISNQAQLRYKAVPKEIAVISHYLLWFDDLMDARGDILFLCEGPFDALKINLLGRRHGIYATCFFTSAPTAQQIDLLHTLVPRFTKCVLLLDRETELMTMRVLSNLRGLAVQPSSLPQHRKDPAELNEQELLDIAT